ncbi:MAG: 2Fe-2S iron-sulfur cluster binding domain-containing protein [Clostridia bacterium]|nr:2Fe-2S iron-sulfur cluster binding domain-containing protein [Clostridia bacterium]
MYHFLFSEESVKMTIDGQNITLPEAPITLLAAAARCGITIPVLCYREGLHPVGGCGICTVEDTATGRLHPACATRAVESMVIVTNSERVLAQRRAALELLLSNHPADCEAPCEMACPSQLPVPKMLALIVAGRWADAEALAKAHPVICGSAPCEKVCRRKPLGGSVAICAVHRFLTGDATMPPQQPRPAGRAPATAFRSRMTGLSQETLQTLSAEPGARTEADSLQRDEVRYEARRCLACGCLKPDHCALRTLSGAVQAKQSTYAGGVAALVRVDAPGFHFDSSRCVLCGICVRTAQNMEASVGPSFRGRGFDAQIAPPLGRAWHDIPAEVLAACAEACPTGAMCRVE